MSANTTWTWIETGKALREFIDKKMSKQGSVTVLGSALSATSQQSETYSTFTPTSYPPQHYNSHPGQSQQSMQPMFVHPSHHHPSDGYNVYFSQQRYGDTSYDQSLRSTAYGQRAGRGQGRASGRHTAGRGAGRMHQGVNVPVGHIFSFLTMRLTVVLIRDIGIATME